MSELVIHGVPGSPYMRAVQLACEEKRAPYRIAPVTPGGGDTAERRALHAFGRIPVIDHGDFRLYETPAITRYIDAAFGPPTLTPSDTRQMARMNQIIGIIDWYFFQLVGRTLVFQRVVGPVLFGRAADEAVCAAAIPDAERCIGELNRLMGDNAFLASDAISHADLVAVPHLFYFAMTPESEAIFAKNPQLKAWLERMCARESVQRTAPPASLQKSA
ncbi:MAG: glutathione S-transferase family protein [Terricaulis sp.]